MIHHLKIEPRWFDRVKTGEKKAEVRKHDRDFQKGDTLVLVRANATNTNDAKFLMGVGHDSVRARVTHVLLDDFADGLFPGYCLLSIEVKK